MFKKLITNQCSACNNVLILFAIVLPEKDITAHFCVKCLCQLTKNLLLMATPAQLEKTKELMEQK